MPEEEYEECTQVRGERYFLRNFSWYGGVFKIDVWDDLEKKLFEFEFTPKDVPELSEYKDIKDTPAKDLPLLVNHEFSSELNRKLFEYRLKG